MVLGFLNTPPHLFLIIPGEISFVPLPLWMRKYKTEWLAQCHTADKWQSLDLNLNLPISATQAFCSTKLTLILRVNHVFTSRDFLNCFHKVLAGWKYVVTGL